MQEVDSGGKQKAEKASTKPPGVTLSEDELKAKIRNREIRREDLSVRERELLDMQ